MLAVMRSKNFKHPGNWFGVIAVLLLAWKALPSTKASQMVHPKHIVNAREFITPAMATMLVRYEELRNGRP